MPAADRADTGPTQRGVARYQGPPGHTNPGVKPATETAAPVHAHAQPPRNAVGTLAVCLALATPVGAVVRPHPPAHAKRHHHRSPAQKPAVPVGGVCPDAWLIPALGNVGRGEDFATTS